MGQPEEQSTRATIDKFDEAFNRYDADAFDGAFVTDDTGFENTSPAPHGRRIEGKAVLFQAGSPAGAQLPICDLAHAAS